MKSGDWALSLRICSDQLACCSWLILAHRGKKSCATFSADALLSPGTPSNPGTSNISGRAVLIPGIDKLDVQKGSEPQTLISPDARHNNLVPLSTVAACTPGNSAQRDEVVMP